MPKNSSSELKSLRQQNEELTRAHNEISDDLDTAKNALKASKDKLLDQNEKITQLTALPSPYATVIYVKKETGTMLLRHDKVLVEQPLPPDLKELQSGDMVRLNQLGQVIDVAKIEDIGEIVEVTKILDDCRLEIQHSDWSKIIFKGDRVKKVEIGDKVVVDNSASVIITNLGKDQKYIFDTNTGISWEDIGGLEHAKEIMRETIEHPHKYANIYKKYGKRPIKGVLLCGPPGCGKTLLGKAAATALGLIYKNNVGGFLYIKGPEILNKYVGESERIIRHIFAQGLEYFKKHNAPCIIFIDEAESILSRRGSGISSDVNKTIVPMFLAEMDGLHENGSAVVILATNRADMIDSAITRDERIDRKVKVNRPTQQDAYSIMNIHLSKTKLQRNAKKQELITSAIDELFSESYQLYEIIFSNKIKKPFYLQNLCSGAMIKNLVDHATSIAIRRDLKTNSKQCGGVNIDDLKTSVEQLFQENVELNHDNELDEFTGGDKSHVKEIRKISNSHLIEV